MPHSTRLLGTLLARFSGSFSRCPAPMSDSASKDTENLFLYTLGISKPHSTRLSGTLLNRFPYFSKCCPVPPQDLILLSEISSAYSCICPIYPSEPGRRLISSVARPPFPTSYALYPRITKAAPKARISTLPTPRPPARAKRIRRGRLSQI